jgi:Flp pilus assembly pilin Flp
MHGRSQLTSAVWHFTKDDSGRSLTEFALLAAIVIVVLVFLVLAVRKISLPGA